MIKKFDSIREKLNLQNRRSTAAPRATAAAAAPTTAAPTTAAPTTAATGIESRNF